ncbi:MAG: hypothetical protein KDB35_07115, partial [Acidimicrobiales bacterium]|nr:hypothetical protein [Acidimicrobiales bacterium]
MAEEAPAARRPSRVWFALPALVLIAALAMAVSLIGQESNRVEDRISAFERTTAPGQADLDFTEAGEYLLYVEGPVTPNSFIDPTEIILLPAEPGARRTTLRRFDSFVTYNDADGLGGHAEFTFEVPEPGPYHLKVRWSPEDINGVAVGPYVYEGANDPVRRAFGVAVAGALAALALTAGLL